MPTIYIDTNNLLTATAAYLDEDLTTKAPDGYYRYDGVIYREQSGGVLLPPADCPYPQSLAEGVTVSTIDDLGVYYMRVNVGSDSGVMMVLEVDRSTDFILPKIIYDGTTYDDFYCADTTTSPTVPYGGIWTNKPLAGIGTACVYAPSAPKELPQWQYDKNVPAWVDSGSADRDWGVGGTTTSIRTADKMYVHVYKSSATPTFVDVEVAKYCSEGPMDLVVNLKTLTPITTTSLFPTPTFTSIDACSSTEYMSEYVHDGVGVDPAPGDFIYYPTGATFRLVETNLSPGFGSRGYFKIPSTNKVVEIYDGYVMSITSC